MSTRFHQTFTALQAKKQGAFVPFVTLCDPDFETSAAILKCLCQSGADALELGIPFSDPCADGPVIQVADKRAIKAGETTSKCFELISNLRKYNHDIPVSLLVYANLVKARGIDKFFKDAAAAGIDAVLIPDVPVNMLHTCDDFCACAKRYEVNTVLIAPPNADDKLLEQIARITEGYTYVLSRYGITGTDNEFGRPVRVLNKLHELKAAPSLLGFGISKPEHVKMALEAGADGAIAGSAVVKLIGAHLGDQKAMLEAISSYVKSMKAATIK